MTMGVGTILEAQRIVLFATGSNKAATVNGPRRRPGFRSGTSLGSAIASTRRRAAGPRGGRRPIRHKLLSRGRANSTWLGTATADRARALAVLMTGHVNAIDNCRWEQKHSRYQANLISYVLDGDLALSTERRWG